MSEIEMQFQPIAHAYGAMESDEEKSRYELAVNWPSLKTMLPDPPAKIMDYGCGSGTYTKLLLEAGYDVLATDNAPDMIAQLKGVTDKVRVWSYQDDPLGEQFDAIIAKLVVQFVEDLPAFLQAMRKQLGTDGRLIISVPNPERSRLLLGDSGNVYLTKIGDSDLEVKMIHRELEEYRQVGEAAGFKLVKTAEPVDPLAPSEQSKRLNMLFEAV